MKTFKYIFAALFVANSCVASSTDIFYAIFHKKLKMVKTWVAQNPDLSVRNDLGQGVLHAAVLTGNETVVKAILNSKIDVNLLDKANKTALDYAFEYGYNNIVILLVKNQAKVTSVINDYGVQKIIQKSKNYYWLFYFGLKCVAVTATIVLSTLLVSSFLCHLFGVPFAASLVNGYAPWSTYFIHSTVTGLALYACRWPYLLIAPVAILWSAAFVGSFGFIMLGAWLGIPVGFTVATVGVGTGFVVSSLAYRRRSYILEVRNIAAVLA